MYKNYNTRIVSVIQLSYNSRCVSWFDNAALSNLSIHTFICESINYLVLFYFINVTYSEDLLSIFIYFQYGTKLFRFLHRFPPEVIAIDTSGKFFERMCSSRKSLHIESTGETDTVKRRTRTRKPRGKRRNTISGTDQKELREAIAG